MDCIVDIRVELPIILDGVTSPELLDALIGQLDGPFALDGMPRRIERALVGPTPVGDTQGFAWSQRHELVIGACRRHPERIYGAFLHDPRDDVRVAVPELERLVGEYGFRAVVLHLTIDSLAFHNAKANLWPVLEAAQRLHLGVLVHTGEPPLLYPAEIEPLVEAFPDVSTIIASCGIRRQVLQDQAIAVASSHENVWVDTSGLDLVNLKKSIRKLGASKLMFGSNAPYEDIWSQLRPIEVLCHVPPFGILLSEPDRERVFGGNAAEIFGLKELM